MVFFSQCWRARQRNVFLEIFLSYKLRCYTRISSPEKSRSNTREKKYHIDIANQLLTRHLPLAPHSKVDE